MCVVLPAFFRGTDTICKTIYVNAHCSRVEAERERGRPFRMNVGKESGGETQKNSEQVSERMEQGVYLFHTGDGVTLAERVNGRQSGKEKKASMYICLCVCSHTYSICVCVCVCVSLKAKPIL